MYCCVKLDPPPAPVHAVLLISFDGFRSDYLDNEANDYCIGNIRKLWSRGVRAEYMESSFVTKTFPNHYTLATGLWAESHGVVDNQMLVQFFDLPIYPTNIFSQDPEYPDEVFRTSTKDPK